MPFFDCNARTGRGAAERCVRCPGDHMRSGCGEHLVGHGTGTAQQVGVLSIVDEYQNTLGY